MKLTNYFSPIQMRIFFGATIAMFLIMSMMHLEIQPLGFLSPIPEETDIMDQIKPELETNGRSFTLKEHASFIPKAHAAGEYDQAASYLLINLATGDILHEKASAEQIPIASLTKIMTAVVALDLASPDESFTVTSRAAEQIPTKIGVKIGEKMTLHELLEAAMLTSANDSVQVISDGIDSRYQEAVFVRAMNAKAAYLGLQATHFSNPQGFDNKGNYSSARDLAILSQYALTNYPLIAEIVKKEYVFLPENSNHKQFDLYNWNGLIGVYPNVSGVKIGNTDDAGRTTLVVSERGGETLLVVLLGAPGILERDLWASQLLDLGFEELLGLEPVKVTPEALYAKYATWKYGK